MRRIEYRFQAQLAAAGDIEFAIAQLQHRCEAGRLGLDDVAASLDTRSAASEQEHAAGDIAIDVDIEMAATGDVHACRGSDGSTVGRQRDIHIGQRTGAAYRHRATAECAYALREGADVDGHALGTRSPICRLLPPMRANQSGRALPATPRTPPWVSMRISPPWRHIVRAQQSLGKYRIQVTGAALFACCIDRSAGAGQAQWAMVVISSEPGAGAHVAIGRDHHIATAGACGGDIGTVEIGAGGQSVYHDGPLCTRSRSPSSANSSPMTDR